jgi:putative addiction module component (TIGR02574 family)
MTLRTERATPRALMTKELSSCVTNGLIHGSRMNAAPVGAHYVAGPDSGGLNEEKLPFLAQSGGFCLGAGVAADLRALATSDSCLEVRHLRRNPHSRFVQFPTEVEITSASCAGELCSAVDASAVSKERNELQEVKTTAARQRLLPEPERQRIGSTRQEDPPAVSIHVGVAIRLSGHRVLCGNARRWYNGQRFVVLHWGLDVNVDTTAILIEIGKLPVEDQIVLVQRVWDAIADSDTPLELTDAQKAEISRRSAELDANPDMAIPWEEVRRSLKERRRR